VQAVRLARPAATVAVAALAAVSTAITYPDSWRWISDQREAFSSVEVQPAVVFRYQQLLPAEAVDFVRERVRPKERYFLLAPRGADVVLGVPRDSATRTFARYALLPAVQVPKLEDADVVVAVGVDPGTLDVPFERVEWDPSDSGVAVARLAR
jgi:hypothetical protein